MRATFVSTSEQTNDPLAVATDTPQISVVVPTRNRSSLLRTLLGDLIEQEAGDLRFEVVVVDSASRDDTRAVALAAAAGDARLRYVYEPVRGASNARNRGMTAACARSSPSSTTISARRQAGCSRRGGP